jgi:hypothetical protein
MSFLKGIPPLPSSNQMLFAFWCRIPQASFDKARTQWQEYLDSESGPVPPMIGIVPLAVFGTRTGLIKKVSTGAIVPGGSYDVTTWSGPVHALSQPIIQGETISDITFSFVDWSIVNDDGQNVDPSYIGIDCRTDRNLFTFNFQFGSGVYADDVKGVQFSRGADPSGHTNTLFPLNDGGVFWSFTETTFWQDVSRGVLDTAPEAVRAFPGIGSPDSISSVTSEYGYDIEPDHWHQVLLAVQIRDMSAKAQSIGATSLVYAAIDGNPLTGKRLAYYTAGGNKVISPAGYAVSTLFDPNNAADSHDTGEGNWGTFENSGKENPIYSFTAPVYSTGLIDVPGDEDSTLHVEMAEMDMYSGYAPNVATIVSAFIDENVKPVKPETRDELLGIEPDNRLHRSDNWIKGKLTGAAKGTATPIGKIKRYRPDPSLNGPQSPK